MTGQPAQGLVEWFEAEAGMLLNTLYDGVRIGEIQAALVDIIEAIAVGATP
jgi:hypothetical protein